MELDATGVQCRDNFFRAHPELQMDSNIQLLMEEMTYLKMSPAHPLAWEVALMSCERRLARFNQAQVQERADERKAAEEKAEAAQPKLPDEFSKEKLRRMTGVELKSLIGQYGRDLVYRRLEGRG